MQIADLFIRPDIRRKRVTVTVTASGEGEVRLSIDGTAFETKAPPGAITLDFPDHELWSPDTPVLYTLRCEPEDDPAGAVCVRFGMREFTAKEDRFYFNNRPLFIKGVYLDVADAGALRDTLVQAKAAGFNLVRLDGEGLPDAALEAADELGMLVCLERSIGPFADPDAAKAYCAEALPEILESGRNHPSLAIRSLQVRGPADPEAIPALLAEAIAKSDPSRVALCTLSGHGNAPDRDLCLRPYRDTWDPYEAPTLPPCTLMDPHAERYLDSLGDPGLLTLVAELPLDSIARTGFRVQGEVEKEFAARGLDRLFTTPQGLVDAARPFDHVAAAARIDALRANSKIAGYCCSLGPWSAASVALETLPAVQQPLRPIIHLSQTNLVLRQDMPVTVTLANDARLEGRVDLSLQVVGPTNQVLWKKKRSVKVPRHGKLLWDGTISASGSPGVHRFVVRLMATTQVLAENAADFQVFNPIEPINIRFNLLDPDARWSQLCAELAVASNIQAPVHIIPPLGNTIRAYPNNDLAQVLGQVKEGAVALFFEPPEDWNDLAELIDPELLATSRNLSDANGILLHYNKLHPVFDGLPAGTLMGRPYRELMALKTFVQTGEEDICGALATTPHTQGTEPELGNEILVLRYGSGQVVFTHLRVFQGLGRDPIAKRLFVNMLKHFARRSVPSEGALPVHQQTAEWLRGQRVRRVRRWMVVGPFAHWNGEGHEAVYPPEDAVDLDAAYPGCYEPVSWTRWYSVADEADLIDLGEAFDLVRPRHAIGDWGVLYLYGEFVCDRRGPSVIELKARPGIKIWVNGKEIHGRPPAQAAELPEAEPIDAYYRQGRNTLLIKLTADGGARAFSTKILVRGDDLGMTWWK